MTGVPALTAMLSVIDSGARTRDDIFTGPTFPTPHGRAFGGQVLGQALAAAGETTPDDRLIHSMHCYFIRPGDSERRMTFEVARLHDGRSFSTRRVQAYQGGEVLMSLIASFQTPSPGFDHQDSYDVASVTPPGQLPGVWDKYGHLADGGRTSWVLNRPFDFRYVESDIFLNVEGAAAQQNSNTFGNGPGAQRVWLRSRDSLDNSHMLHAAALAFASDYLLVEPILRHHDTPWATPGLRSISLDHAMWFHRSFRADDWLLYVLESPVAQGGRGLGHGRFYNRDGELVVSVSQEAIVRKP